MPEPKTASLERRYFLSPWHYPQYRLLFLSSIGTYIGRWMDTVVTAWLVLELTDSPFLVGLLGTGRFVSMLLGPFCGAIADRFDRRPSHHDAFSDLMPRCLASLSVYCGQRYILHV